VRILEEDRTQFVAVGDSAGPAFDGIAPGGLSFSSDGQRMAYPARKGDRWTVVVDGTSQGWWDGIGALYFSSDGSRLAYSVLEGARWRVVVDGVPGPPFDALLPGTLSFHPRTGRLAYAATRDDAAFVVLGAEPGGPYDQVSAPVFLPTGEAVAFLARNGSRQRVVVGGRPGPLHEAVAGLALNPATGEPAYFFREGGEWFALVGDRRLGPYDAADGLTFSAEGQVWAFLARKNGLDRIVHLGGEGPPHAKIQLGSLRVSRSGEALAYVAQEEGSETAVIDFHPGPSFHQVRMLDFSPTGAHYAYVARDSLGERVVLDGAPGPVFMGVSDLTFSDDGGTLAYLARDGEGGIVLAVTRVHRFPVVVTGTLVVGREGRHWAAIAGPFGSRDLHYVVDGEDTGRAFDWEELIDTQWTGPQSSPDLRQSQEAVRNWVRAEMELFLARGHTRSPAPSSPNRRSTGQQAESKHGTRAETAG
jgi:hypothetical protein